MIFEGLLRAAELNEGAAAGFLWRHASIEIFFDGKIEVSSHFGVEVAVEGGSTEECGEAMEEAEIHGRASGSRK
jgi:hypothetical protein